MYLKERDHSSRIATYAFALFFARSASGAPIMTPEEPRFFLLPTPETGEQGEPTRMVSLLSAPVIEPLLIEREAEKNERIVRQELLKRREAIRLRLCSAAPVNRVSLVASYTEALESDYRLWLRMQSQYESALEYRLTHIPALAYNASLIGEILKRKRVSADLRVDRQKMIRNSWMRLFGDLLHKNGCESNSPLDIPPDRLFLPYYHSLHLFYRSIPDPHRSRIILLMREKRAGR
jgi:hypothetical protein